LIFLRNLAIAVWMCAGLFASAGPLAAQDSENPPSFPPARPPDVLAPGIRPDVYLLRNAQGDPVAVPRVGYEEYERIVRESSGEPDDPPALALSQLDLLLEPETDFARVQVDAELRLTGANRSWLTVPIGLPQLQWLPSSSNFDRSGIVSQSNGYVWRIEPGLERQRRLKLEALCKMTSSNSGNSIRLDLPSTATVVRLKLPRGDWELTASGGGSEVVEPFRIIDESAIAIVRTTANSLNLVWNRKQERQAITAVEATSLTKFTSSDDGSQIKAITTWSLRGPTSLAGKRFTVTLPRNGQLRESSNVGLGFAGYRMMRRDTGKEPPEDGSPIPWIIDIDVEETLARTDLEIAMEWQIVGPANPEALVCETPTIEGVQAHSGTMECIIPRGVVFQWKTQGEIRLVRQGPSTDGSAMAYAFRFASQPVAVIATWQSLLNRPRMRSLQELDIREGSVSLQGRLEFISDPTQLPLLQLECSTWQIDRLIILPAMLELDRTAVQVSDETQRVAVPLNASLFIDSLRDKSTGNIASPGGAMPMENADRSTGSSNLAGNNPGSPQGQVYAIEYSLSQKLSSGSSPLALSLPQISWLNPDTQQRVARTPPGSLRVQSRLFRLRESEPNASGLIPTLASVATSSTTQAPASAPFALSYQIAESSTESSWKGERFRRASSTKVQYEASGRIVDSSIVWNHRWTCRSAGVRPDRLNIFVPKDMPFREWKVDGKSVEARNEATAIDAASSPYSPFAIPIQDSVSDNIQASEFLITALSDSPLPWNGAETLQVQLLFPFPQSLNQEDVLAMESAQVVWLNSMDGTATGAEYHLDPDRPRLETTLRKPPSSRQSELRIESEWVQTILNAIYQRDRYVACFTTEREWIDIPIPAPLRKDLEIFLEGRRIAPEESTESPDHVRVPILPKQDADQQNADIRVIEIFTLRSGPEGFIRKIALDSPRLQSKTITSPLIWQVIVPRTEHLIWNSSQLAPLYRWEWKDLFFVRSSERTQQWMEKELGATEQPEVSSSQTNQYDLSTLTGNEPLTAWFVPRSLVWLPVAFVVLLLSMSLGENSLLGRPWLWVGILSALFLFSQWSWDISILVAQTMLGAIALAIAYMMMRWLLNRRARRRSIFVSRSAGGANPYTPRVSASANKGAGIKEPGSKGFLSPTVDVHPAEEGS
jgi:hypothetical protein